MHPLTNQLTLGLSLRDEATFVNFHPGENAEIVAELKRTARGEGERIIFLCETRGQGASHLLKAACHASHEAGRTSVYLPLAQLINYSPEMLVGLEALQLVCIDDLHVIAAQSEWEEGIFHLFNRIYDAGGVIILAANKLPKLLQLQLPDLISRLSWGIVYQLQPLSDTEKLFVLIARAKQRGIVLSEEVGKYMLTHCPRNMGTLFAALDALDKASLAAKRRLTVPFVKEVLEI